MKRYFRFVSGSFRVAFTLSLSGLWVEKLSTTMPEADEIRQMDSTIRLAPSLDGFRTFAARVGAVVDPSRIKTV